MCSVQLPAGCGGGLNTCYSNKMAYSTKYWHWSAWESLKNSSSAKITISSECSTQWFMLVFRVWIVKIAIAIIMLAWLQKERKSKDRRFARSSDLPVLYFSDVLRRSYWSCCPWKHSVMPDMVHGGFRQQTFQVCHLCTFKAAAGRHFHTNDRCIWKYNIYRDVTSNRTYISSMQWVSLFTALQTWIYTSVVTQAWSLLWSKLTKWAYRSVSIIKWPAYCNGACMA